MNIKAEVIPQDSVIEQVKTLSLQNNTLETETEVLERKLEAIKASLAENETLKKTNEELLAETLRLFDEEWTRRADFFPDIRLEILTSSAALNAPPKK